MSFDTLKVKDLKALAADFAVDVDGLKNKADINHIETSLWYTPLDYLINNKTYTPVDKENIKKLLLKNNAKTFMDIRIPDCR